MLGFDTFLATPRDSKQKVETVIKDNQIRTIDMNHQHLAYPPESKLLLSHPAMRRRTEPSNHFLRSLSIRNDRNVETSIGTLQHQLLMPPCLEEIANRPDKYEPPHNHQCVC